MSYDRDLFLDTIANVSKFKTEGLPVEGRWSTALTPELEGWWLDPQGKDFGPNAKYYRRDVAEAKKLLAAAGYPNGFEILSNYVTGPELGLNAPNANAIRDGFAQEIGIQVKIHSVDYLKEYIPNYRDAAGQFEGWAYASSAGGPPTGGDPLGGLAQLYWSKGGKAFRGFSTSGRNDQSGDPQVDSMIEKARLEPDREKRRSLVFELQRYLAKPTYLLQPPGTATSFNMAWPAIGNFRVWRDGRPHYRLWIDDSKPPLTKT